MERGLTKDPAQKNIQKNKEKTLRPSRATSLLIVWRKLRKSKLAIAGFGIILFMSLIALLSPIIAPYDPSWMGTSRRPPSMDNIFGTDNLGRDMLTLVMHGARISLYVGIASVLIEMAIGISIGMIAGYFGGIVDEVLMRITDVIFSLPALMMLLLAVSMFATRGENIIILIMGILDWPFMARVVRGEYLSLRETTYVEAARSMGASGWRIMSRHILPNMLSVIIVLATMDVPWFIFYEATLTFLGFGDPSSSSWGVLLQNGYMFAQSHWWMITFPGLAILFTSLGFNLLGDGLRDALDVKVRE
jgi:ABC-type dipeptide/oligopeptide/nickel transport system permease subunit